MPIDVSTAVTGLAITLAVVVAIGIARVAMRRGKKERMKQERDELLRPGRIAAETTRRRRRR